MTIYLPTDCWDIIKDYLLFKKDERRTPPHAAVMKTMVNIMDDICVQNDDATRMLPCSVWIPYGEIVSRGYGNSLDDGIDFDDWDEWYLHVSNILSERLFIRIMEASFNDLTIYKIVTRYHAWDAVNHQRRIADGDLEYAERDIEVLP